VYGFTYPYEEYLVLKERTGVRKGLKAARRGDWRLIPSPAAIYVSKETERESGMESEPKVGQEPAKDSPPVVANQQDSAKSKLPSTAGKHLPVVLPAGPPAKSIFDTPVPRIMSTRRAKVVGRRHRRALEQLSRDGVTMKMDVPGQILLSFPPGTPLFYHPGNPRQAH
jgi:hypothetical protein